VIEVPTPSQTVGPFFHIGLPDGPGARLVPPDHPDAIRIVGTLRDGAGNPVNDALIEIWQAHPSGRYAHPEDTREELPLEPGFAGFGRCATDAGGHFEFVTIKPGPVPWPDGGAQAPHIEVGVFARGLLKRLVTRIYFPGEAANASDPVLRSIEDPARREALLARPEDGTLRFDIRLQEGPGAPETPFFDV
jgi:protocatechuate 3,4-dioxygenase alpha subunit